MGSILSWSRALGTSRRGNKRAKRRTKIFIDPSTTQAQTGKEKDIRFGNKIEIKGTLPFEFDLFENPAIGRLIGKPMRVAVAMESRGDVTYAHTSRQHNTPSKLRTDNVNKQREVRARLERVSRHEKKQTKEVILRKEKGNRSMGGGKQFKTTKHEFELKVLTMNSKRGNTTIHEHGEDVSGARSTECFADGPENVGLESMKLGAGGGPKDQTISNPRPNKRHNKNNNRRNRRRAERGNAAAYVVHKGEAAFDNFLILKCPFQ